MSFPLQKKTSCNDLIYYLSKLPHLSLSFSHGNTLIQILHKTSLHSTYQNRDLPHKSYFDFINLFYSLIDYWKQVKSCSSVLLQCCTRFRTRGVSFAFLTMTSLIFYWRKTAIARHWLVLEYGICSSFVSSSFVIIQLRTTFPNSHGYFIALNTENGWAFSRRNIYSTNTRSPTLILSVNHGHLKRV